MDNQPAPVPPTAPQPPVIPESEMKLPEEGIGGASVPAAPSSKHLVNPLLIALFVLLLAILAVVIIWGEALVGLILPADGTELTPIDTATTTSDAAELEAAEQELKSVNFDELEAEMNAIEAEIEAELNATSTATTTAN